VGTDEYHPADLLGYQTGRWYLGLDLKISQLIQAGQQAPLRTLHRHQQHPQQLDYGSNFDGTKNLSDGTYNAGTGVGDGFGTRLPGYQANLPRYLAVGGKFSF